MRRLIAAAVVLVLALSACTGNTGPPIEVDQAKVWIFPERYLGKRVAFTDLGVAEIEIFQGATVVSLRDHSCLELTPPSREDYRNDEYWAEDLDAYYAELGPCGFRGALVMFDNVESLSLDPSKVYRFEAKVEEGQTRCEYALVDGRLFESGDIVADDGFMLFTDVGC
ncbi:MAG: hypothetical protein ACE5IZ_07090 [Dehalococcoidia bacterium]